METDHKDRNGKYDQLTREQLIRLLDKRDRERKLGLVWERDELEADRLLEGEFVAATPVAELNEGPAPWDNLIVEGDNFDALRWLRMTWTGRIKCIYVDPPYNTGNKDWVYNDHYFSKDNLYRHSTWLEFLYQRFSLARDLLSEDGVILVSINDENRAKLEMLLDEVFPGMRVGSFVWRTKDSSNDADRNLSSVHEHVLAYGKAGFSFLGYELDKGKYSNPDNDLRGDYSLDPITKGHSYKERENTYYPIQDPQTGWWYPCNPDSVWRYASRSKLKPDQRLRTQTIEDLIEDNRISFSASKSVTYPTIKKLKEALAENTGPADGKNRPLLRLDLPDLDFWVGRPIGLGRPSKKAFWNEKVSTIKPASSWIKGLKESRSDDMHDLFTGKQGDATTEIQKIFGSRLFDFPKPSSLIQSLIEASAGPDSTILDFFAGSGTTAQAVMALNAEDDGGRRFIMVSSTESTEDEPQKNLCRDITAGRIRRINASKDFATAGLNAAFAYLRCRKLKFEDLDYDEGLSPEETWVALESLHQLPLTPYAGAAWIAHETGTLAIVYADRFAQDLIPWLKARAKVRKPTFVYSWAPGQIREQLDGIDVEVRSVRDTLIYRFKQ